MRLHLQSVPSQQARLTILMLARRTMYMIQHTRKASTTQQTRQQIHSGTETPLYVCSRTKINSFEPQSSPYHQSSPYCEPANDGAFTLTTSYTGEVASMNLLRQLSDEPAQTPPLSPGVGNRRPRSSDPGAEQKQSYQPSPLKTAESPSRASVRSQQFTTPPTSPINAKDELEELFDIRPGEPSMSQFDLEMKAMSDFASTDNNYDFLDFTTV